MCVLGLAGAGGAGAQQQEEPPPPPDVAYRQSVMRGMLAHRVGLEALLDEQVSHSSHILWHVRALDQLAAMASDIFPEGSNGDDTRAKDEIWQQTDAFAGRLNAFHEIARGLLNAAESGDLEAVREASDELRGTCRGCHREFRKPAS